MLLRSLPGQDIFGFYDMLELKEKLAAEASLVGGGRSGKA